MNHYTIRFSPSNGNTLNSNTRDRMLGSILTTWEVDHCRDIIAGLTFQSPRSYAEIVKAITDDGMELGTDIASICIEFN